MAKLELKVPDVGDYKDIPVIEILVKVGDVVAKEQSLVTLESDKATMEVPADTAGTVVGLRVKLGDKVSEGTVVAVIDTVASASAPTPASVAASAPAPAKAAAAAAPAAVVPAAPVPSAASGGLFDVKVPDVGDYKDIPVIEILVKVGDTVKVEQSLVTLESDKATMEVPSLVAGVVKAIKVSLGDKVSEGTVVVVVEATGAVLVAAPAPAAVSAPSAPVATPAPTPGAAVAAPTPAVATGAINEATFSKAHASPSIRKIARELGVDLGRVKPTGPKNRVMLEDVRAFVKAVMNALPSAGTIAAGGDGGAALGLLPWPKVDFTKFGEIEAKPLSRIKKISGANLHRNWVLIPHVTNHDECDITDLEAFRVQLNKENEKSGVKVSMLAFMIKASVAALKKFPNFNSSLDGENQVLKRYYNIGFAADTPNGLVVPVIKNADQKGIVQIAKEMSELAGLAREGKLKPDQMQGGCFSISSLGGIGGRYFTPIINAPEVAIMGVCKSEIAPKWNGKEFEPHLMLPLSLSWDHRVLDGAEAARFNVYFGQLMSDFRRIAL